MAFVLWYLCSAVDCFTRVVGGGMFGSWCIGWLCSVLDCCFGFVINSVDRFHGCVYFNLCWAVELMCLVDLVIYPVLLFRLFVGLVGLCGYCCF